ncbi:alpha/beta hydrolase [Sediminibacterium sp. KACHI17]|uniref:Alpha/beta hydrolase n=1 Tax=Sediminibacterium sp. KACHI17 TaxID=1751071 RepID=A0AAT9GKI2_9BACT
MKNLFIKSQDGIDIHCLVSEPKTTALIFVHGWLGNANWWNHQQVYFEKTYRVVQIDLPGRGQSGNGRKKWSSTQYAYDIKAVADSIEAEKIILIGHSMSGPYVLEASLMIPQTKMVVLVDTLKNMDQLMNYQQANKLLFTAYRNDFSEAIKQLLPKFLYSPATPISIIKQLEYEFLRSTPEYAIDSIGPLYKMAITEIAKQIQIPVRAINSDLTPTIKSSLKKYLKNFEFEVIPGTGHYPMLEKPNEFNVALEKILREVSESI